MTIERTAAEGQPSERVADLLGSGALPTPCLVVDLDVVAARYRRLVSLLPDATVHYAVAANPAPEVLRLLVALGSSFHVASVGELDRCLAAGADPHRVSYGSTVKKQRDIAYAFGRGVRHFGIDSDAELRKVVAGAPASTVFCRIASGGGGGRTAAPRTFGCDPDLGLELLLAASRQGLGVGTSFHVGTQQRDPEAWDRGLATAADLLAVLRAHDVEPSVVDLGGGLPAGHLGRTPPIERYAESITAALHRRLGDTLPGRVMIDPGRHLVADAGVLQTEVVLVARTSRADAVRCVHLDLPRADGLVGVVDGTIRYRIRTPHDEGPVGPVVLAGLTGDRGGRLAELTGYRLPLALRDGDRIELLSTGAYPARFTSSWADASEPLHVVHLPASEVA